MSPESFNSALARLTASMAPVTTKQPRFRGLLYSNSGVGKTVLAAQIMRALVPEGLGIIYVDTSEGWISLRNHEGLSDGIMAIPFTTIEDIRVIGQAIKQKQGVFAYIGGIILDEASSMSQIDTDRLYETRKAVAANSNRPVESLTPEWADYNAALARFRAMLSELFDIEGLHVMLNAHVSEKKDSRGNITSLFPSFSPSIAKKVKEPLHLVGHMTAVSRVNPANPEGPPIYERVVQVHPTTMYDAKTRLPINATKVPAAYLPGLIADWINAGGVEVTHDSTPREDTPEENPLEGMTSEEALTTVDEAANAEPEAVSLDFEPINL